MKCLKCEGRLCKDKMWDVPRRYEEWFCINCGGRYWLDTEKLLMRMSLN